MSFQVFLFIIFHLNSATSLDNGLTKLPPMGWLSWEKFRCETDCKTYPTACIDENLYTTMADLLVSEGYSIVGYNRIHIDDCWPAKQRDANGRLVADPIRFPHGMKWLADYMHGKGVGLGIYEDSGTETCAKYPGSMFHSLEDSQTFAQWGIDYLKFDACNTINHDLELQSYKNMSMFLMNSGRKIVFGCELRADKTDVVGWQQVAKLCNVFRTGTDIHRSWGSILGVIQVQTDYQDTWAAVQGPTAWCDPDQILGGNWELTDDMARSQFGLWAIWSSPLLMSNDLRNVTASQKAILQNKEVIGINQDSLGVYGKKVAEVNNTWIYNKKINPYNNPNGEWSHAIAFFNPDEKNSYSGTVKLSSVGLSDGVLYETTDVFTGKDYGKINGSQNFTFVVNPAGILLLKTIVIGGVQ